MDSFERELIKQGFKPYNLIDDQGAPFVGWSKTEIHQDKDDQANKLRDLAMPIKHESQNDYTMDPDGDSAWIGIGPFSLYILPGSEGLSVQIFHNHNEMDDPVDTMYALWSDGDDRKTE